MTNFNRDNYERRGRKRHLLSDLGQISSSAVWKREKLWEGKGKAGE